MSYLTAILIGIMLLFLVLQLLPLVRAFRIRGRPAPDLSGLVDPKLLKAEPLLFYFFSPGCGMCRSMTPFIDKLALRHANLVKVDVSETTELAGKFGVMGTPTLVLIRAGKVEQMLVGAKSEKRVLAMLED